MPQLIAQRYIPAGSQERSYTTPDGKGHGVVYWIERVTGTDTCRRITYHATGYRGKAFRPSFNYLFRTKEQMNIEIENFFLNIKKSNDYKQEQMKKRRDYIPSIKAGDILDTCWGYDQTNREFFQVIRVTGKTAVLREIAQKEIAGTGPFSSTVIGVKDQFCDKEIMRRILPGDSIKIDECRYASIWDGKPAHCSWGA